MDDKHQIKAVFVGTLAADFLPVQLVYQGKTTKCLLPQDLAHNIHTLTLV